MAHSSRSTGNMTTVTLSGNMDTASAPETTGRLKEVILNEGANLALDMSGVTFIDSMALSVLVSALKLARKQGGDVVVLRPTSLVRSLLDVTRLDHILRIYEDEESAAAAFAG